MTDERGLLERLLWLLAAGTVVGAEVKLRAVVSGRAWVKRKAGRVV